MEIINWDEILIPYEKAVEELEIKFKGLAKEYKKINQNSPIEDVVGRVKSVGSILQKANRKNILYENIEKEIEDIAGIRIICRFVEDIEKVVSIIKNRHGKDMTVVEERDYINNTKPSGYRSFHIILKYPVILTTGEKEIFCEIQIRTLAMNFWATIEHSLRYKYNYNIPEELTKRLRTSAEAAFNLDKEMSKIRGEILEAQHIIEVKNNLVDDILEKMNLLYNVANLEEMNDLNKQFLEVYNESNINNLEKFDLKITTLARHYDVEFAN